MINAFPSIRIVDGYFHRTGFKWTAPFRCLPERAAQITCYNQTVIETERIQKLSALYDFIFAIII